MWLLAFVVVACTCVVLVGACLVIDLTCLILIQARLILLLTPLYAVHHKLKAYRRLALATSLSQVLLYCFVVQVVLQLVMHALSWLYHIHDLHVKCLCPQLLPC